MLQVLNPPVLNAVRTLQLLLIFSPIDVNKTFGQINVNMRNRKKYQALFQALADYRVIKKRKGISQTTSDFTK